MPKNAGCRTGLTDYLSVAFHIGLHGGVGVPDRDVIAPTKISFIDGYHIFLLLVLRAMRSPAVTNLREAIALLFPADSMVWQS